MHRLCVCVGGVQATVWLSLFHCVETVKVGISAHRPQHILCLKTDTKLTSSLSLYVSQILWPTFNGKTQRFVVEYWKLSLWLGHNSQH